MASGPGPGDIQLDQLTDDQRKLVYATMQLAGMGYGDRFIATLKGGDKALAQKVIDKFNPSNNLFDNVWYNNTKLYDIGAASDGQNVPTGDQALVVQADQFAEAAADRLDPTGTNPHSNLGMLVADIARVNSGEIKATDPEVAYLGLPPDTGPDHPYQGGIPQAALDFTATNENNSLKFLPAWVPPDANYSPLAVPGGPTGGVALPGTSKDAQNNPVTSGQPTGAGAANTTAVGQGQNPYAIGNAAAIGAEGSAFPAFKPFNPDVSTGEAGRVSQFMFRVPQGGIIGGIDNALTKHAGGALGALDSIFGNPVEKIEGYLGTGDQISGAMLLQNLIHFSPDKLRAVQQALYNGHYITDKAWVSGQWNNVTQDAYVRMLAELAQYQSNNPLDKTTGPEEFLNHAGGKNGTGTDTTVTRSSTESKVDLSNPATAQALVTKAMQDALGRDPNPTEIAAFSKALLSAEQANATVTTTNTTQNASRDTAQNPDNPDFQVSKNVNTTSSQVNQEGLSTGAGLDSFAKNYVWNTNGKEAGAAQAGATYFDAAMQALKGL